MNELFNDVESQVVAVIFLLVALAILYRWLTRRRTPQEICAKVAKLLQKNQVYFMLSEDFKEVVFYRIEIDTDGQRVLMQPDGASLKCYFVKRVVAPRSETGRGVGSMQDESPAPGSIGAGPSPAESTGTEP